MRRRDKLRRFVLNFINWFSFDLEWRSRSSITTSFIIVLIGGLKIV